jgi:copper chaperone CopZ
VRPALVLFAALLAGCGGTLPAAAPPPPRLVQAAPAADLAAGQEEVSMEIIELMCRPCASQIVGDARLLPGMISVHMELATKTLTLRFDTGVTQRDRVIAAMEQIVSQIQ